MLLQHLESLAKTAYSGISSNPEESSGNMVEEYSKELNADVQTIKTAAASFNQDAAAAVNRYQAEYEMHLTVWLNALSKCKSTANADSSDTLPPDIQRRNRRAENKFKRFREWRDKAMKGVQRKFLPRTTPVTELESAKANLKEREDRQRLMKKANAIIRSKKDVTPRLIELLGPGSEEEAARLQQPDEQETTGYTPHELNNNNANIFRLKRRVKELERKISLMELSNEEMKEVNGIKMIYNYAADRIQLFFTEKPQAGRLRQLKGNGWHWSPSAGCWQRKITELAKKSAESIYKGEFIEEKKIVGVATVTDKTDKVDKNKAKSSKKSEAPIISKSFLVETPKTTIKKAEEVVAKKEEEEEIKKEEKVSSKIAKHVVAKKEKLASKRELKREIMIKPKMAESKIEVKPKAEEKPKAIDWAKIAAAVELHNEPEVVPKPEPAGNVRYAAEDETATRGYSYEAYAD